MALILSLETSALSCSVALHREGALIKALSLNEPQAHAARLATLIDDVFQELPFSMRDLHAVAVSSGPGSYTGLRIGTSTAKGICYALNIPLIAVNTLDLLAYEALRVLGPGDGLFCPMIDARRMEVYCQVVSRDLKKIRPMEARIIDGTSFSELLEHHRMFFIGDGAAKCREVLAHENSVFPDGIYPAASALGLIAVQKFDKNEFEDLTGFVPVYLKEFVAKKAQPFF